jgi:PAS domain S-box-containing protein
MSSSEQAGRPLPSTATASTEAGRSLFDLLVEQVVDYAIYVVDPDGLITTWNSGAERIKGYRPQDIIGQPYTCFFTEADRQAGRPQKILAQAREEGRYHEEGWRVRKDGTIFWASVVVTALFDQRRNLQGYAKITRDLTERRKAEDDAGRAAEDRLARLRAEQYEREVRRSRDQLDLILRSIAEGVTVQDAEGRFVFVNDAAAHLCGFESAHEMMSTPRDEILTRFEMSREDGTSFPLGQLPGRLAFQGLASSTAIKFKQKRSGDERWSYVSAAPVVDAAGNIEFAVSIFREFTEQRRTEQSWRFLAEASATLGSSLDYEETLKQVANLAVPKIADWCSVEVLAPDGSLRQLAVAHSNPAKLELAKEWRRRWPPNEQSMAFRVLRSGTPELLPEITEAMIVAAAPDPLQRQMALELGLRSAVVAPLIVDKKPFGAVTFVTAESGRIYGQEETILASEISRRASLAIENARAYTEARTAIEIRDNFMSIASHELRTPLSALTILMTSLSRAASQDRLIQLGPQGLRDRMAKAERQTTQLTRLVDRLLDVSRLSSREMQLDLAKVDLAEVTREVISRMEDATSRGASQIHLRVDGPAVGQWDPSRLDQVVTNLLTNAVKYGAGSPITISVGPLPPDRIRLVVKDEGPGIASEHQERVFGQFERAASPNSPGMGLGLWIISRIVQAHGGSVTLQSSPGQGACFTVELPIEPPVALAEVSKNNLHRENA